MPEYLTEDELKDFAENFRYPYTGRATANYDIVTYSRVSKLYHSLMKDERNKRFTKDEQETLVQTIIWDLATSPGTTEERERYTYHSCQSNRHMDFFDNFIAPGEAGRIEAALAEHGLSTDILKGISFGVPDHRPGVTNGIPWDWDLSWTTNENNTPVIEDFTITSNGIVIYKSGFDVPDYDDVFQRDTDRDEEIVVDIDWNPEMVHIPGLKLPENLHYRTRVREYTKTNPVQAKYTTIIERNVRLEDYVHQDTGRRHQAIRDMNTGRFVKWK